MDNIITKEKGPLIDLESGGLAIEEETSKDLVSGDIQLNNVVSRVVSRLLGSSGATVVEGAVVNSCSIVENSSEAVYENIQLLIEKNSGELSEEHAALVDMKHVKEKRKKTNLMKASKPPRPPKGPSLDACDMKLVKEISELAMKKRARIERIKALRKMKAAKASSSSNTSLAATIITVLFVLVLLFQGICSRSSSSGRFHGSPEPAVAASAEDGLISVQFFKNSDGSGPNSVSPSSSSGVEHISVSELSRFPE